FLIDGKVPGPGHGGAAESPELTRSQLLDGCGIEWALLTGAVIGGASRHPDREYANALCRAFNDVTAEQWLAFDSRFRYAMTVNLRDPDAAVHEIERFSD